MSEANKNDALSSEGYIKFYPPLIRLQESAPHPLSRKVVQGLFALLVFLLIWSVVGRLDIVAVAEGKLIPENHLKIVQPSDAGIIKEILVREGDVVEEGQLLMRMDMLIAEADLQAISSELQRKQLQLIRIEAELAEDELVFDNPDGPQQDTLAQYEANRQALQAALAEEEARLSKARQEQAAALQHKTRILAVLPHYRDEEKAYQLLVDKGFSGKLMASDKRRERLEKEHELATQEHLIASAGASIEQSIKKKEQIKRDYIRIGRAHV